MKRHHRNRDLFPGRIVVGVDEHGQSDHAIHMALDVGRRFDVAVDLVHASYALPDAWPRIDPQGRPGRIEEALTWRRKELHAHVRAVVGGIADSLGAEAATERSVSLLEAPPRPDLLRIVRGDPGQVLSEEVRRRRAGLVVLGAHQRRKLPDLGNTVRGVFARSRVPVWIQPGPVQPIRSILAAVDLSEESLSALATACSLAKMYGARVRALHSFYLGSAVLSAGLGRSSALYPYRVDAVRTSDRSRFEQTMEEFDWEGVGHAIEFVEGEPVERILQHSATADLIVIGARGRTGLASVVLGGTAYALLKRARKPTLVVRISRPSS